MTDPIATWQKDRLQSAGRCVEFGRIDYAPFTIDNPAQSRKFLKIVESNGKVIKDCYESKAIIYGEGSARTDELDKAYSHLMKSPFFSSLALKRQEGMFLNVNDALYGRRRSYSLWSQYFNSATPFFTTAYYAGRQTLPALRMCGGIAAFFTAITSGTDNYIDYSNGQISASEAVTNVAADTSIGAVASVAGIYAGMKVGAALGSLVPLPVVGTVVGALVGGAVGYLVGWGLTELKEELIG